MNNEVDRNGGGSLHTNIWTNHLDPDIGYKFYLSAFVNRADLPFAVDDEAERADGDRYRAASVETRSSVPVRPFVF